MKLLLSALLLLSVTVHAQKIQEYKAANGITYHEGDTVHLGKGAGTNSAFINMVPADLAGRTYATNHQGNELTTGYSHMNVIIKKIKQYSLNGSSKTYFTVEGGRMKFFLAIDDAVDDCEVKPCKTTEMSQ